LNFSVFAQWAFVVSGGAVRCFPIESQLAFAAAQSSAIAGNTREFGFVRPIFLRARVSSREAAARNRSSPHRFLAPYVAPSRALRPPWTRRRCAVPAPPAQLIRAPPRQSRTDRRIRSEIFSPSKHFPALARCAQREPQGMRQK
jgi:hypothetical protein